MTQSFAELKAWLDGLPDQEVVAMALDRTSTEYRPAWQSPAGKPYVEFYAHGLARPDDVAIVERAVADQMFGQLSRYLGPRKGRIYWRIPFETDVCATQVVVRHDDNGPDTDFLTDKKCVKDGNWMRVACYCRLYRSKEK